MSWNYRVMKVADPSDDVFGIHEVYYDENGVKGWTQSPVRLVSDTADFNWLFDKLKEAVAKPVLNENGKEI